MHQSNKREFVACDAGNVLMQRIESGLLGESPWSQLSSTQTMVVTLYAVYVSRL